MPLTIDPYQLGTKRGALLRLNHAIADVAPLPGWSEESIEEAISGLSEGEFFPSMAFAIDSLLWQQKHSLFQGAVSLCALAAEEDLDTLLAKNFRCLKFKIKGLSIDHIVSLVKSVGGRARVRLDANRSLSADFALELMHALPRESIDFVEEPVKSLTELKWLAARAPLPLALDESLRDTPLSELIKLPSITTWVLKPTLLGSFGRILALKREAERHNIRPLLSSSCESAIGICTIAQMATTLNFPKEELGLDTSWLLEENFFTLPRDPLLDLTALSDHPFFQSCRPSACPC